MFVNLRNNFLTIQNIRTYGLIFSTINIDDNNEEALWSAMQEAPAWRRDPLFMGSKINGILDLVR